MHTCSVSSRDGAVLLAHGPDVPEVVPPFFDHSGVDLSQLLPAAYTRELRGEAADPEHRHVAIAFVELRGTDELLEREGPQALAAALDETHHGDSGELPALRRHVRADGREQGGREGDPPRGRAAHRGRRGRGTDAARDARDRRAAGNAARPRRRQHRASVRRDRRHADAPDVHVLRRCHQHRRPHHGARGRRTAAGAGRRARARAHDLRRNADRAVRGQGQGGARPRIGRRRGRRRARAGGDRPVRRAGGRARHAARGAGPGGRGARPRSQS